MFPAGISPRFPCLGQWKILHISLPEVDAYTTLGNVTLTYYRKPLRFNTTDGASKCELPESIHSEIVDLAVNMFITEGKYRLQVKQPNNQQ